MTIGSGAWADRLDALLRDRRELFEAQAEENILMVDARHESAHERAAGDQVPDSERRAPVSLARTRYGALV